MLFLHSGGRKGEEGGERREGEERREVGGTAYIRRTAAEERVFLLQEAETSGGWEWS